MNEPKVLRRLNQQVLVMCVAKGGKRKKGDR